MQGSFDRDARGAPLAATAFLLAPALVVALAAPVAGQVAGPESHEAVKKRALWTNCLGVSLRTLVSSDTDLSEESVWNAAEAALRSARIYYDSQTVSSRWVVMVRVVGVGSAHSVTIEFLDAAAEVTGWALEQSADDDRVALAAGVYTVVTYRVGDLSSGRANPADLLGRVRTHMDAFLVDYLRAHPNCATP